MQNRMKFELSSVSIILLFYSSMPLASGYAAPSISASALGAANANAAASSDPGSQFYNPANLTQFTGTRLSTGMLVADASIDFVNDGSTTSYSKDGSTTYIEGGDAGDPIKPSPIPQFYLSHQLSKTWFAGLAVNVPNAFEGSFNSDWIGRYDGTASRIFGLNINPSLAWKPHKTFSVGIGISAQYFSMKSERATDQLVGLTNTVNVIGRDLQAISANLISQNSGCNLSSGFDPINANYSFDTSCANHNSSSQSMEQASLLINDLTTQINDALAPQVETNNSDNDGYVSARGDDLSFGYNIGIMLEPHKSHRVGISYRSKITHNIHGTIKWDNARVLNPEKLDNINLDLSSANINVELPIGSVINNIFTEQLYIDGKIKTTLLTPATASLHSAHNLTNNLSLMTDLTWTEWSAFKRSRTSFGNLLSDSVAIVDFQNTLRASLAIGYQYSPRLKLTTGFAFDQSPAPAGKANPSLPDSDRRNFSLGAEYSISPKSSVSLGATYISFADVEVNYQDYGESDQPSPLLTIPDLVSSQIPQLGQMQGVGLVTPANVNNHTTKGTFSSSAYLVGVQYNYLF